MATKDDDTADGQSGGQRAERLVWAVDRRLPLSEAVRSLIRKAFPDHWSFLLGELALYSFMVLVLTGVYLTFFFHPDMTETVYRGTHVPLRGLRASQAYISTVDISFDVRGGLLTRQIHHWAALVFVAAIGCHLLRVFFTGAFRRPREGNWAIGVTLFMLSVLEGFCGYSLPDDLLSGTGLRTAEGIVLAIPVLGTYLAFFLFGGQYPGHDIVSRLYAAHILLIPGVLVALVTAHLILVVYLKHTQWAGRRRANRNVIGKPFFPQYTAKSLGLFLTVFGLLSVLAAAAQINPIWEYGPYRPDQVSTDAQPDWYVGFLEGSLRLMPGAETRLWGHTVNWNPLIPGAVLPVLIFVLLYAYPFFERWATGDTREHHLCDRPRNQPVRTGLGAAAVCFYGVLLLAGGQDVLAYTLRLRLPALTWFFRVLLIVGPLIAYKATRQLCVALQRDDHERVVRGDPDGLVRQVGGAYRVGRTAPTADEVLLIVTRDAAPPPMTRRGRRYVWVERVRVRLNAWYAGAGAAEPVPRELAVHVHDALVSPDTVDEGKERERA